MFIESLNSIYWGAFNITTHKMNYDIIWEAITSWSLKLLLLLISSPMETPSKGNGEDILSIHMRNVLAIGNLRILVFLVYVGRIHGFWEDLHKILIFPLFVSIEAIYLDKWFGERHVEKASVS